MKYILLVAFVMLLQSCATVSSVDRPDNYRGTSTDEQSGIFNETILGDDDDRIRALLNYRVELPKVSRIAVLKLNTDNRWRFYSDDFTQLSASIATQLIDKLRSSERVFDASFLPAMLIPAEKSVPVLREATARFQADLLLGYRTLCNSYQKYYLIAADETKSYCSVEAVLLGVWSGIIVKSVVSVENFDTVKKADDKNFSETIKKAELEATAKALGSIAEEVVSYLNNVPVL